MQEERQYLQSLFRAASEEKAARAYYAMEGASRFMTFDSVQAAAISNVQAAELTPMRDINCDSIFREAADITKLDSVARR